MTRSSAVPWIVSVLTLAPAVAFGEVHGRVVATALKVRDTPQGRHIDTLQHGQIVRVVAKRGSWLRILDGERPGWVYSRFVRPVRLVRPAVTPRSAPRATTVAASAPTGRRMEATTDLRLRSGPGTHTRSLGGIPEGEAVTVLGSNGNWRQVRYKSREGWVYGSYLRPEARATAGHGHGHGHDHGAAASPGRSSRGLAGALRDPRPAAPTSGPVDRSNLSGLQPDFRAKVERVLRRLQAKGWQPRVAEGRRTRAQQAEKVRRGYSRTMNSRHLTGRAADIVDRRWGWEGPAADTNHRFWRDLGAAAKAEGLTWGGDWRSFKDVAHVQQ